MEEDQVPVPPSHAPYGSRESAAGLPYAAPRPGQAHGPPVAGSAPAQPGLRLVARLVDIVAVGVVLVAVQVPLWTAVIGGDPALRQAVARFLDGPGTAEQVEAVQRAMLPWAGLAALLTLLVWFLYEVPSTALRGRTLGKVVAGVRATGAAPRLGVGWGRAVARWAVLGLPLVFGVFGFAFQLLDGAWLLWDRPRRQCLHDKLAGTVVVPTR